RVARVGAHPFPHTRPSGGPRPGGQPARQPPPLAWEGMAFKGDNVYTASMQEIWGGPTAGAMKRIAGSTEGVARFADGPCADARFGVIWGIAVTRDGALVVADNRANAILSITDPDKPSCKVTTLVGPK